MPAIYKANFGNYQLNKHVAMFGNFDIDDSFVCQFWLLAIDQTRSHVSQLKSFVCYFEKGQKLSILETDNIVNFGN